MIGQLRIERDGLPPHRVELAGRPLILGGAPNADIPLDDRRLSHRHCKVEVVGHQLVVTDLGSSDGTYVRGQRIRQLAIDAGEAFTVGSARITFDMTASSANADPGVASTLASPLPAPRAGLVAPSGPAPPPARVTRNAVSRDRARIEGYRIVRRLGEGSMGIAYLARSEETGQDCVLKTIDHQGQSRNAIFFIREVQMGSKLRHPNIVPVVDFGESGGLLFLAMEYVTGGSLQDCIDRNGPLENAEALGQLVQLTDALDYASRKKFVHRDIKPANILLTADGVPKLADFGVAKMLSETQHAQLTRTGEARGTPIYMSPEILIRAADADTRADIYSLGATYYHALAGGAPFDASSLSEVLRMVASHDPVRLEERNPNVHPELARVITRMMRKRLEDRYPTTQELAEDLGRLEGSITS